jgi:phage/plasmid-associated DNA primase
MSKRISKSAKSSRPARSQESDEPTETLYTPSVISSDIDNEIDPIEFDVNYKIQSIQSTPLSDLISFFSDPKCINPPKDPTTNIIDRFTGKCYKIPDNKIPKFFKLYETCRRNKERLMINERQQKYSGIMLDFDIYQDAEEDQITDEILNIMCQKIVDLLMKILKFKEKKETIQIAITRRPKITYNEDKGCWKDGFHIIIPSVKVSRGVKHLLINKLIDNELIDQIMCDVQPASMKIKGQDYQRKDFLDVNSAFVPAFFLGSSTKKGHSPYQLTHIYEASINTETKNIVLVSNDALMKDRDVNIAHEFSLSFEVPNGHVRKTQYEIQDKYINEIQEIEGNKKLVDDNEIKSYGELSMYSIHDIKIKELQMLLDTLAPARYEDYKKWFDVLCVLANTSVSYKGLAEIFSRKSAAFKMGDFEKYWSDALHRGRTKKSLTLGSLHYWAKQDNPERYEQVRKQQVFAVLYDMAYDPCKEGLLSHSDIAKLLYQLLQHKYVTDIPEGERNAVWYEFILDDDVHVDGELYKWRKWKKDPVSLANYIDTTLPKLFDMVFKNIKKNYEKSTGDISKYYNRVLQNFKRTVNKLGDRPFKKNVMAEAEDKFNKIGFAESLDTDPLIRGVQNGILKLSLATGGKPQLIQGYHSYKVSKHTKVPYIPFNPRDPITKEILIALRNLFPDKEPDSFEFTMSFLASTIDGNPKESMFMIMVGKGANGKSFLVELHKGAIGSTYGVKMPLTFLTTRSHSADNATPALMQLKEATFAYYSESEQLETLYASRVKEVTGLETISGRKLHQDMINFKPRCHHLVTTNYDFKIECNDHGTWRRIEYNPLKITFVDVSAGVYDPTDPYQRIANDKVTQQWTEDPEIQGRYLGFMVWMHYWLYRKYRGKVKAVPHPHIKFETTKYRRRQDTISAFLAAKFIKTALVPGVDADGNEQQVEAQFPMGDEIQKYIKWYAKEHGGSLPAKGIIEQFQNSEVGKHIKNTARGWFLIGHKFLDGNDQPGEGESYAMKHIFDMEVPEDNFGIEPESPEQYYDRICREYDANKSIFDGSATYDVDVDMIVENKYAAQQDMQNELKVPKLVSRDNNLDDSKVHILPNGIVLRALEEPSLNYLTDEFHLDSSLLVHQDDMYILEE